MLSRYPMTKSYVRAVTSKAANPPIERTDTALSHGPAAHRQSVGRVGYLPGVAELTRGTRVNLIALTSALTLAALGWQSHLMEQQNSYSAEQAYHLKEQVSLERSALDRQLSSGTTIRRIELLSIIYDRVACGEFPPEKACPPKASGRARQEAVVEFLGIERGRGILRPDLSKAPLADLEFISEDFSNVMLNEADLSHAKLSLADFSNADLSEARLTGATMMGSNFQEADMLFSDLSRAFISGAKFNGADLSGAVLVQARVVAGANFDGAIIDGVDLSDSRGIKQEDLEKALGNHLTILPKGLVAPAAWSSRKSPTTEQGEKLVYIARKMGRSARRLVEQK
jgi:uncharacterized protein YjbI with pentapeptide repeats